MQAWYLAGWVWYLAVSASVEEQACSQAADFHWVVQAWYLAGQVWYLAVSASVEEQACSQVADSHWAASASYSAVPAWYLVVKALSWGWPAWVEEQACSQAADQPPADFREGGFQGGYLVPRQDGLTEEGEG